MRSKTVPFWLFLVSVAIIFAMAGASKLAFWLVFAAVAVLVFKVFSW